MRHEVSRLLELEPFFLDTETTGLGRDDEIVDISIVDFSGRVLFDNLIKPLNGIPSGATGVHGISDETVRTAYRWKDYWPEIQSLLSGKVLGIYNEEFDVRLIQQSCRLNNIRWKSPFQSSFCIMKLFARYFGQWDDYHQSYTWQNLERARSYFSITLKNTHRALDDALLAREVFLSMSSSK